MTDQGQDGGREQGATRNVQPAVSQHKIRTKPSPILVAGVPGLAPQRPLPCQSRIACRTACPFWTGLYLSMSTNKSLLSSSSLTIRRLFLQSQPRQTGRPRPSCPLYLGGICLSVKTSLSRKNPLKARHEISQLKCSPPIKKGYKPH